MDEIKNRLDEYEGNLHRSAEDNIQEGDLYMQMSDEQKDELFDEAIVEFEKSLQIALKKLNIMKSKVQDMSEIMQDFKSSTAKLESLYLKDIEQRKQYYLDHPNIVGAGNQAKDVFSKQKPSGPNVDYDEIHRIFDEIEREEARSALGMLFNLQNLIMMAVIGASGFIMMVVGGGGGGSKKGYSD